MVNWATNYGSIFFSILGLVLCQYVIYTYALQYVVQSAIRTYRLLAEFSAPAFLDVLAIFACKALDILPPYCFLAVGICSNSGLLHWLFPSAWNKARWPNKKKYIFGFVLASMLRLMCYYMTNALFYLLFNGSVVLNVVVLQRPIWHDMVYWVLASAFAFVQTYFEEYIFRGPLENGSYIYAILLTFLFVLGHLANLEAVSMGLGGALLAYAVLAVKFALPVLVTGTIDYSSAGHFLNNVAAFMLGDSLLSVFPGFSPYRYAGLYVYESTINIYFMINQFVQVIEGCTFSFGCYLYETHYMKPSGEISQGENKIQQPNKFVIDQPDNVGLVSGV